jgi:hypothetical protein
MAKVESRNCPKSLERDQPILLQNGQRRSVLGTYPRDANALTGRRRCKGKRVVLIQGVVHCRDGVNMRS